jgi:DNA repair protein RadC
MNYIREQLQMYGATVLSTPDLLAFTLSHKTDLQMPVRLAQLLQQFGVPWLRRASTADLEAAGLTRAQAERLVAVCELMRRLTVLEARPLLQITAPSDAIALLRPLMEDLNQEVIRVLVLNAKNQVMENLELYRGTVNCCLARVAEIFRPAVIRNCPAILVAHIHPSGSPDPSPEDITLTNHLVLAGKLLEIDVVDHLILGHASYTSLRSRMQW